jgi:hypothetical protein
MRVLLIAISMVLLSPAASSHFLNVYAQKQQGNGSGAITSAANTSIPALTFKGNSLIYYSR